MLPARAQQSVGKDVAPLGVGAELDFVNRQEIGAHALGHRLDRADPIGGAGWHDAFLARHQRDDRGATDGDDLVIDLARQQAQRQPDNAGTIPEHAVDGVMRLARVGRPENGRYPALPGHVVVFPSVQMRLPVALARSRSSASSARSCVG